MGNTMTTSKPMTTGQIDRACEIFRAQLVKHASELSSEGVQIVLGQPSLGPAWLKVLRERVEVVSAVIVRRVKVDRSRTPQAVLDATGRRQFADRSVVDGMPRGVDDEVDVHFFNLGRWISDEELEKEYDLRGLAPADPFTLAAVNEEDPAFADQRPNGTHWRDAEGRWCFAAFGRWLDERDVSVRRGGDGWVGGWWFAGVRKGA